MLDLDALDPGIRKTVELIRSWGYETTDSGDGVTKPAAGWSSDEALPEPHVYVTCRHHYNLQALARGIRAHLESLEITVSPIGQGPVYIQATFDPADNSGHIGIFGMNDAMLEGLEK